MELSSLIFVALALAWAVYLIPKALQHHEEVRRSRSVDRFSARMRVLARREPVNARSARFVVTPTRASAPPVVTTKPTAAPGVPLAVRRRRAQQATKRRQRVLATILLLNVVVLAVAAATSVSWWYAALPAGLLVAWLVACRVMVRAERGNPVRLPRMPQRTAGPAAEPVDETAAVSEGDDPLEDTAAHPAVTAEVLRDPNLWDPLPVHLPTYVTKEPAARRTVRTIDLDDTGVWSSGRSESDSAIVREADEAERAARREGDADGRRAVGS